MSRIPISAAEVRAAFEKLLSQATEPTAQNIRNLLEKGGIITIQKHIDAIINASKNDLLSEANHPTPTPSSAVTIEVKPALKIEKTPPAKAPIEAPTQVVQPAQVHTQVQTAQPKVQAQVQTQAQPQVQVQPQTQGQNQDKKRPQFQVKKPIRREPHQNNSNPHHHQNQQSHQNQPNHNQNFDYEPTPEAPLESLSAEALIIKIRRLESSLLKEQARRETAEKIALETKDYADMVKEQVAHRINDLRQNMDLVIEQLKTQLREQKQSYANDLKLYQDQINKANQSIIEKIG